MDGEQIMKDLLIMGTFGLIIYIFARLALKQPILPWKENTTHSSAQVSFKNKKRKTKKHQIGIEQEPQLFEELFSDIKDVSSHMVQFNDNSFTLIGEVEPVNYFLKSQDEQEAIDMIFERWLASLTHHVAFYIQNRFVDLAEPIENMQKIMKKSEDLNYNALNFGQGMIDNLIHWQKISPRYETKRYLVFTHKVNPSEITADTQEELEKKILEKAFSELMRRLNSAKSQLKKADIHVELLPTEGIYELLYHTFNRRKAVKHRFKDLIKQEKNALYVTAEQSDEKIEGIREGLERNEEAKEGA
jgi:hypothetical protein